MDLLPESVQARYDAAGAVALWRRVLAAVPNHVLVADVSGDGVRGVVRQGEPDRRVLRGPGSPGTGRQQRLAGNFDKIRW
ncbi:hypothetical protein [Micromonospora sp. NPDC006431]|uniref:hypothetical protein n=1 Tax=Micromonospora sp. NPDC006431 TaxID=3364235 RepID=UPI0036BF7419